MNAGWVEPTRCHDLTAVYLRAIPAPIARCHTRATASLAQRHPEWSSSPWKPLRSNSSTFRLTRVTRIFQKSVFTETTPAARAGDRAGFFVARPQAAAAQGVFSREIGKET